jgi:CHAT domain-containing protein/tetratricopeptide (TPR) repeat protein
MQDEPMNSDANPNQPDRQARSPQKELAEALEDLVAKASNRGSASPGLLGFTQTSAGACPDLGELFQLASGTLTAEKKDALLAHAALCSACLARLRQTQHALSSEVSQEESAELEQMGSISPQWQHRLAVELAHTPFQAKKRTRLLPSFMWLGSGLAVALVLALSVALWWRRENAPERLLAEAYTSARAFDLRIPGAGFAPVSPQLHLRGGSAEREPAPLLNARAQIERHLEQSPSDPYWLQLEARAEMLEERYDGAIDILDRLVAAGPVTSSLLLDDGSAYFMRGLATGSENDRATALDDLRRADELAPDDPVILFNEALIMEDRGQVMNAVETWNRYLKFERDPKWQLEGRRHLSALEDKLDRLKTHESRIEQHLATPQSMRALSGDPARLAQIDEELSTTELPRLLQAAFASPVDRSRGSPCDARCLAARSVLNAVAASLKRNHQDPWLEQLLPSDSATISAQYLGASQALAQAIDADTRGDYAAAQTASLRSRDLFSRLGNAAGADRAEVEHAYALQRSFKLADCHAVVQRLFADHHDFGWIKSQAIALEAQCNVESGTAAVNNPLFKHAVDMALEHRYVLLELRARNALGSTAVESGDSEVAWHTCIATLHRFYSGDYPPFRAGTTMAGLAMIEDATPRAQLALLLRKEAMGLFSLSANRTINSAARTNLIRAAIRAGSLSEAQQQLAIQQKETNPHQGAPPIFPADAEIGMAELYLDRGDLHNARSTLDHAQKLMAGQDNPVLRRNYAVVRGELELSQGRPEDAESILRTAILSQELEARGAGDQNIVFARQNRNLYAALAAVWLAEHRPGVEILALWERYRQRILGKPVPSCPRDSLGCLGSELEKALHSLGRDQLRGQIVLPDRTLLYRAQADGVTWRVAPFHKEEILASTARLQQTVSTIGISQLSIDDAARRVGNDLFDDLEESLNQDSTLLLEADPLLGNTPWPAVETEKGPIGVRYSLEEVPSLLMKADISRDRLLRMRATGRPLVVGASVGAGLARFLPEALTEARAVALTRPNADLLLAEQATQAHVAPHLSTAPLIHFAGHAAQYGGATRLLLAPTGAPGDHPYLDDALFRRDPPRSAQLVVFSACSTGKTEEGWDHGMGDIVDTLASLGVPQVVATRWEIDSASAVFLMDKFYRGLADGLTVPQALTAARQLLIRDGRYRHPYYWAAYYASGVGSTDLREVFHGGN